MSAGSSEGSQKIMTEDDNNYGKPIVHVEGIEKGREKHTSNTGHGAEKVNEPEGHIHEGETIKTTYFVEEDNPSFYQRLKGKFKAAEYQVRSILADHTKKTNPHPKEIISVVTEEPTPKPHVLAQTKKVDWGEKHDDNTGKDVETGKKDKEVDVKGKGHAEDGTVTSDSFESFSSSKGTFDSGTTEEKKVQAGDELGTGYEESSEEGDPSPENRTSSGTVSLPKQTDSPFKPVKPKDESDITLEELRASKLNQNSSAEDVKAPGMFSRVKEEVDAITDKVSEGLGLKGEP